MQHLRIVCRRQRTYHSGVESWYRVPRVPHDVQGCDRRGRQAVTVCNAVISMVLPPKFCLLQCSSLESSVVPFASGLVTYAVAGICTRTRRRSAAAPHMPVHPSSSLLGKRLQISARRKITKSIIESSTQTSTPASSERFLDEAGHPCVQGWSRGRTRHPAGRERGPGDRRLQTWFCRRQEAL